MLPWSSTVKPSKYNPDCELDFSLISRVEDRYQFGSITLILILNTSFVCDL
jgi:hypothetical protein